MSGTEILDPELNKDQGAVQAQVRHSMAVMAQWANGEKYDEKVMIERGRFAVRQTLEGMFELGRVLIIIKEHTDHGRFTDIIAENFGLHQREAQRLMNATQRFATPAMQKAQPKLMDLGKSKLLELLTEEDDDLIDLADGGSINGVTLDDVDRMTVRELRAALKDSREDLEAARKVSATKQETIDELNHTLEKTRKKLADADPEKIGEELHATLNAAQTGVRSALTQIQPVLEQLIEHGQANGVDHAPTMVGCLNQIIRDCEYLRETYGLPREAPTDATPAWLKDEN